MAALVIARRYGTEVFQPVDGALDDVASFVSCGVKTRWRSSLAALAQPVFPRIETLGANATHAALLDLLPIMACTVGAVHAQAGRALAWATRARPGHINGIEYRPDLCRVTALPGSDHDRQWQPMSIDTQMDLAGDAAPRSPQPLVGYGPLFSAAGTFFRAPAALRWALTCVASSAAPSQSIRPASSAAACMTLSRRCQVPLHDQRTKRS